MLGESRPDPVRRSARRRDADASRAAIAAAATELFAERGYALTGVRDIAARAQVNSALVGRYFGSKENLFAKVVRDSMDMGPVLAGPRESFGHHMADLFEQSRSVPSPLAMILLSMGDPSARKVACAIVEETIVAPLAEWLGGRDAIARARMLNMLWSGYLTHSQLLPNGPSGDASIQKWLADATQAIVDCG